MSKLDEMSSELQENSTEQPVEEKPFDPEEFLNSGINDRRDGYEERVKEIVEERGIKKEDLIEADAYMEKDAREGAGTKHSTGSAERIINSDLTYEYLPDTDGLLFKGNIKGSPDAYLDGKNYEIEIGSNNEIVRSLVDGKELDLEEAKRILDDYANVAASRDRMIDKLEHETNNENNE